MSQDTKDRQSDNPPQPTVAPQVVIKTTHGATSNNKAVDSTIPALSGQDNTVYIDTWYHKIVSDFVFSNFWNST